MEDIKVDNKITVLGKTFNSEEERRNYFREELRKKLPVLKQMEGFPIGKDEDILNLSDPPYYTACPNPWLNDFIAEWEQEKKQLEKDGKRVADFEVDEPYATDVSEGKNNPIYNAHSYHTKVPHPAIMRYILHYTQPGDIVFDGFAGTGMTGVAATLCGSQKELVSLTSLNNVDKNLGSRNAICSDLSPIASLINSIYNVAGNSRSHFYDSSIKLIEQVENEFKWMYLVNHNGKNIGQLNYIVWSEIFSCPECSNDVNFWEAAVEGLDVKSQFNCRSCNSLLTKRTLQKKWITCVNEFTDEIQKELDFKPVFINYKVGKKSFEREINDSDIELLEKINSLKIDLVPSLFNDFKVGDKTKEFFNKGIYKLHDLYTKRTLIILSEIYKRCVSKEQKALFTASVVNLAKTARYKFKRSGNVPMSGTIYVSSLIAESNVFNAFKSKVKSLQKAFNLLGNDQFNVNGINSATSLNNIKENSFDYVFVDPPFGANLMYSELSAHWENWLNIKTNTINEAIENRTQKKSTFEYQWLIQSSFAEFYRVLKAGKWMTVEFSNTSASVWNSIQISIQNTGFIIANVAALDKKQGSYNAVMNPTSVKQDLVISCYKPSSEFDQKFKQHQNTDVAVWDFVEEHLNHLPIHLVKDNTTTAIIERSPKILFDRLIAFYVQKGLPVPIDAGAFQKGLRERFIERDGMFFTDEQVQEYDKKKAENPEFIQLSILVSSEQDGVLWLKNVLTEKSLAYQDIQPLWMQALAGVRKGDVIPELADILEENFLKDEQGKWYVPDPENEADLEKLRTKRLLKQFEVYKTEAAKPKGKIKEVRVEALRAGFKQSYQDKDFKTIVQIGDRIPNNLLMEDEVLLQFYDIASSRV